MTVAPPLAADVTAVRSFFEAFHGMAAAALNGARNPGMLQLVRIHPADEKPQTEQFAIGDIEGMTQRAVLHAEAGFNVYAEPRTVAQVARGQRGKLSDTRGVFAFVIDADADKGRGGSSTAEPTLAVETSPGNAHHWLGLARALTVDEAQPLGEAIRAGSGADSATGVLTQPYRVAGTPNYPGRLKLARGRVAVGTRLLATGGKAWTADELRTVFPAVERPKFERSGDRPTGRSGIRSGRTDRIVVEVGIDRSERFHAAVASAFADGLTPDDLEDLMRQHPEGCGGKYLEPYDRLAREIARSWDKVEARAEEIRRAGATPAYEDLSSPVEEARRAVEAAVQGFLAAATAHRLSSDDDAAPPAHALAVTTGVGKTRTTAKALADDILARRGTVQTPRPILYAVPTHRLGAEIERQFTEHGVVARVFRGRSAPNPDRLGQTMCDDMEAVEIALALGEVVSTSCCKTKLENGTEAKCPHFHSCAYQAQTMQRPDVWIGAHQLLFQAQSALGEVEAVVVDEGFWQAGIRIPKRGLTISEIEAHLPVGKARDDALQNDVESFRGQLARGLRREGDTATAGGVRRADLIAAGLTGEVCTNAIKAEWLLKGKKTPLWPGMPRADRRVAARAAEQARHARAFIGIWQAARGLLYDETVEVSGRLYLDHRDGDDGEGRVLVAKARSVKAIAKAWQVPTLILDATLPAPEILKAFFPQVEMPAPVEAAMPHVRVRQVLDAPVSSEKLKLDEAGGARRNLRAVRREILRRFLDLGRAPILVVAQKAVAEWLRSSGLPAGIAIEWFNNVAGLDQYRDVRGLIVVGRTMPSPVAVEALAGALTGREPALVEGWYPRAVRGLRTRDGAPAGVECVAHPDPVAEACRWQIAEGELMQALGRARGVNRTADTPLDIDIIANIALPLTVDEATTWSFPGEEFEMMAEGIVLNSPADMAAAWPEVWGTPSAARCWLYRHTGGDRNTVAKPYKEIPYIGFCDSVRRFRYQRRGPKQKWRTGAYEPAVLADPRAWLEARLGELAGFDFPEIAGSAADAPPAAPASRIRPGPPFLRAADFDPEMAACFRCVVDLPADPIRPPPVIPEIVRWRPPEEAVSPSPAARARHVAANAGRRRPDANHGAVA